MTVEAALRQGTELLEGASVPAARLTAEVLLAHALHRDRAFLYAHGTEQLPDKTWIHFGRYLSERLGGKPTQYITGWQEFYGREFVVNANVLIPRPETEHLVETSLEHMRRAQPERILDLGTGSGAIAVSLALESGRSVWASDISEEALQVATRNARRLGATVHFAAADLLSFVPNGCLDLLVSNPPYVPGADRANMQAEVRDFEPAVALFAGDSGLEIYARLIREAERVVKPGGRIFLELGYQSLRPVTEMLGTHWTAIDVVHDLAGWPRVIGATAIA